MSDNFEVFKELVTKHNTKINDVICHNFDHISDRYFRAGEDNSLFVLCFKEKYKWIKVIHKVDGNVNGLRLKMYYANTPQLAFNEEQSCELGFMDGEEYTYILKLSNIGNDALRFDFGFKPIDFQLQNFQIAKPNLLEVLKEKFRVLITYLKSMYKFMYNNKIGLSRILRKIRREGFKKAINGAKTMANDAFKEANQDKSKIQVVEPYKVMIKNELLPQRKKVLHFIENFYTGGSSRLIIDIIEHYGHKFEHKIFTMAYRGADEFLNVDVEVIDIDNKKIVNEALNRYSPEIIHIHIWEGEWYHKVFDLLDNNHNYKIIENINTPINPILRGYVNKYIFVSNYVLEQFHDSKDNKSLVIYPGSNFEMFTRKLIGDYLSKNTIGMVYRLGYDKLNQHSIDVFIKTIQKRPQTKAIIVGGGPQYDYYLDKVKKAGVLRNFTFTGYVPYLELPSWYEKFTIFVAPVWKESFGQVSPFAMSMGIPVAGYHIGAINEIVNNDTLLAEPDDSDKLSDILINLLDDYEKCKEIGIYNQERAWSKFGVKTMVDDYDRLYNELTR
ncbi:hypothetical protein acsn021_09520 [Anaerocolumna cellulosilytica]|uniref:Uncharacterized protein n=1 Tax=Anaerocolumna cellulosilytica TaxID=433286 RepID=A0A6S6QPW6_9FIRM|nr:glycosyltransferase family 4 protein [Anaerocolumna cellulosilytica]MBB5194438.1 glycosyltransferase involved in cell wall biosynthesis [Anaerocolumna cellulosilytica]BCJ93383.1 hypothetical protein acsn021_09520 [Anaerocolumna cellulosilytica]